MIEEKILKDIFLKDVPMIKTIYGKFAVPYFIPYGRATEKKEIYNDSAEGPLFEEDSAILNTIRIPQK
jgi:hypothetical protein